MLGLLRSRCFCQDDSHNFVSSEQVHDELGRLIALAKDFYGFFGLLDRVKFFFSSRPDSYLGELSEWELAESQVRRALSEFVVEYGEKPKDGAFYAPKIDIHFSDSHGREWQCGSFQLDYQIPKRFGLKYKKSDGSDACPVVIHRVIYGSIERFLAILLEHNNGRLPFWCSPKQVVVLPVSDRHVHRAQEVAQEIRKIQLQKPLLHNYLRVNVDDRGESVPRRVKDAEALRVPLIVVIGDKEVLSRNIAVRLGDKIVEMELREIEKLAQILK